MGCPRCICLKALHTCWWLHARSHLTPQECAMVACTSSSWRELVHEEPLWRQHLAEQWGLAQPVGPAWTALPTYRWVGLQQGGPPAAAVPAAASQSCPLLARDEYRQGRGPGRGACTRGPGRAPGRTSREGEHRCQRRLQEAATRGMDQRSTHTHSCCLRCPCCCAGPHCTRGRTGSGARS